MKPRVSRAIVFGLAWLPSLALVLFVTPRYQNVWGDLEARGHLPASTEFVLTCRHASRETFALPFLAVFVMLLNFDAEVAKRCTRRGSLRLYRVCFLGVIVMGLLAAMYVGIGILPGLPSSWSI